MKPNIKKLISLVIILILLSIPVLEVATTASSYTSARNTISNISAGMFISWIIGIILTLFIFYLIIKAAVKNAILEVLQKTDNFSIPAKDISFDKNVTVENIKKYMTSRYAYYDRQEGTDTKDNYTSKVWEETANYFGISEEIVSKLLEEDRK